MKKLGKKNKQRASNFRFMLFVFFLSGIIMIGHGSRMIYQGVFQPGSVYSPNIFDIFFDWLTLLVLGIIVFCYALINYYYKILKTNSRKKHIITS